MYKLVISTKSMGSAPLRLETKNKNLARSTAKLCKENDVECKVTRTTEEVAVNFKL